MRLSHLHAHQVAKALQAKGFSDHVTCPCGAEVLVQNWALHRRACTVPMNPPKRTEAKTA